MVTLRFDLRNLKIFAQANAVLGAGAVRQYAAWTLNQVGNKMTTEVKRMTAKQLGLPYGKTADAWKIRRAFGARMVYSLTGSQKYWGMEEFKPHQTRLFSGKGKLKGGGVTASPWGRTQMFHGAFMLGGKVYARMGPERGPLQKLMAGAVPREMERDEVPRIADRAINGEFPVALERKLSQFMPW